jgi:hypothetical protein
VTVVSLPARGRPPQAAARRAGLEFVEKLLTERNGCSAGRIGTRACFVRVPSPHHGRTGYWLWLLVVLVVVAVAQRRLGPSRRGDVTARVADVLEPCRRTTP